MSSKARLCAACGHYAGDKGVWVHDEDGVWYVCNKPDDCMEGATLLDPQPPPPTETH